MLIGFLQDHQALLDGIGIFLCLLILGCLIGKWLKSGRKVKHQGAVPDFGDQVIQCMVSEHTHRAVKTVMAGIEKELRSLAARSLDGDFAGDPRPLQIGSLPGEVISGSTDPQSTRPAEHPADDAVAAVSGLLEQGMDISGISRKVQRPVAEVELCAWLARYRQKVRIDPDTRYGRQ